MSARANVVINDRKATPVAHTFSPDGEVGGIHVFSEKTGVPAGDPSLTISLKESGGRKRSALKLRVPVVQTQTINGIDSPVIVRYAEVNVACSFDVLSTEQERKDAIGLMANALAASQAMINDLIVNYSDIY